MDAPRPPGLLGSFRQLLATVLELAQVRLALLGNELEEQKLRLLRGLVLALLGVTLLGLAVVLACGFVIVLFWDQNRLAVIAGLAVLLAAGGGVLLWSAAQGLRSSGQMFGATLREMARDRSALSAAPQEPRP